MNDSRPLLPDLLRWSVGHAAAMTGVTLATVAGLPLWLLSLCGFLSFFLLLYRWRPLWSRVPQSFGAWILLPGLLRYVFVLFVKFAKPPESKERRSTKAGWISCF